MTDWVEVLEMFVKRGTLLHITFGYLMAWFSVLWASETKEFPRFYWIPVVVWPLTWFLALCVYAACKGG